MATRRKQLGDFIRKRRDLLGESQRSLSRKARLSHTAWSKLEAGEVQPEIETLDAVARALDIPITQLLDIYLGKRQSVKPDPIAELLFQLTPGQRQFAEEFLKLLSRYS